MLNELENNTSSPDSIKLGSKVQKNLLERSIKIFSQLLKKVRNSIMLLSIMDYYVTVIDEVFDWMGMKSKWTFKDLLTQE